MMTDKFEDLEASKPEDAYNSLEQLAMPAMRNFARQVIIVSEDNETVFNREYPFYPMSGGPFSGNPAWYQGIKDIMQEVLTSHPKATALYFSGLASEYEQILTGINELKASKKLDASFECHFRRPDLNAYRSDIAMQKAEESLKALESLFEQPSDDAF